jgi:transposase-like protein
VGKTLNPAVARVLKRPHYPLDVILTCVRWYQCQARNTHRIRQKQYLNTIVEQDDRATKRRIQPMLEFKKFGCACILLKRYRTYAPDQQGQVTNYFDLQPTPAQQSHPLAA